MSAAVQDVRVDSLSELQGPAPDVSAPQAAAEVHPPARRPAYDPNNLCWLDAEERKYDDTSDGIDWDEIIATTQDDFLAGRFAFNSADYPSHEEAMIALDKWTQEILEEVLREVRKTTSTAPSDATRS